MICFRDMSFCADSDQCANASDCKLNFDDEQKAEAKLQKKLTLLTFKQNKNITKGMRNE